MTHIKTKIALGLGCGVLLAACGGGGGGGGTSTPPVASGPLISGANAQEASASGYSAADGLNGQAGGGADFVTGVSVSAPAQGLIAASLKQLYWAVENRTAPDLAVGVTTSRTLPCPYGGSGTVTGTTASSVSMTAGDRFTISASHCKVDSSTTLNGSMTMVFEAISGMPGANAAWSATLVTTLADFAVTEGTLTSSANGDMTIKLTQANLRDATIGATGNTLKMVTTENADRTEVTMTNYRYNGTVKDSLLSYNVSFSMSGNLPKLGHVDYAVKTSTDFKQSTTAQYPFQGVMSVTAADKTSTTLTVIDGNNVSVGVDKNGDGTIDETVTSTWPALMARI